MYIPASQLAIGKTSRCTAITAKGTQCTRKCYPIYPGLNGEQEYHLCGIHTAQLLRVRRSQPAVDHRLAVSKQCEGYTNAAQRCTNHVLVSSENDQALCWRHKSQAAILWRLRMLREQEHLA